MAERDIKPLLPLAQAAERLQWSVRTLRRKLVEHGIGTIGSRRLARLAEQDLERLIEAERQPAAAAAPRHRSGPGSIRAINRELRLQSEVQHVGAPNPASKARMQSYWRRRNAQLNRKKRRKPAVD
jgi:hypothetical protein